jgi:hypothetical protein
MTWPVAVKGKDHPGLLANFAEGGLVAGGRGGQLRQRGEAHVLAPEEGLVHPGKFPFGKESGLRGVPRHGPGVRDGQVAVRVRPLQEGTAVQAQCLADLPLGLLDQPVHLVGRHVDEPGGEVGEECLEVEALLQFRPQGIFGPRHRASQ